MDSLWKARLRPLNRLRWARKVQISRHSGAPLATLLPYVLWDPELGTFSYELAETDSFVEPLAAVLGSPPGNVAAVIREFGDDRTLREKVANATRGHPESKRRPPLGRHLIAYVCLRVRRPKLAVEVGVRHGLGSLVMLRALELNAEEGSAGRLLSIDIDPSAGVLVDPRDASWEFSCGAGSAVLGSAIAGRGVGFILSDSVPDPCETGAEFSAALGNPDFPVILMQNGAWNSVTDDLVRNRSGLIAQLQESPTDHWCKGRLVHVGRIDS